MPSGFVSYHQCPVTDLPNLWALIKADLLRARNLVPNSSDDLPSLRRYCEFLEHNELELACDALEDSAKDRTVSSDFWLALRDAASKMQLEENAARYQNCAENRGI
jgi:hypothetical protein